MQQRALVSLAQSCQPGSLHGIGQPTLLFNCSVSFVLFVCLSNTVELLLFVILILLFFK